MNDISNDDALALLLASFPGRTVSVDHDDMIYSTKRREITHTAYASKIGVQISHDSLRDAVAKLIERGNK